MFFIGFAVGVFVGIMMIALCKASGNDQDEEDAENLEDEEDEGKVDIRRGLSFLSQLRSGHE